VNPKSFGIWQGMIVDFQAHFFKTEAMGIGRCTWPPASCWACPTYPLQPSPHWTFNGQSLKALYEAVHDGGE
jgi:hypothetical protein